MGADMAEARAEVGLPTSTPGTPNRWHFVRVTHRRDVTLALPPDVDVDAAVIAYRAAVDAGELVP